MKNIELIKLINEEIQNFDFLGNEAYNKEEEKVNLLKNEDFQKQFICDSLIDKNNIKTEISDARLGGDWEYGNQASHLSILNNFEIVYQFDANKEPIEFSLKFEGDNVPIRVNATYDSGSYDTAPNGEADYSYIEWTGIDVTLWTSDGVEIDFISFKKAPEKIKSIFIRHYTESLIAKKSLGTNEINRDDISSIPYC